MVVFTRNPEAPLILAYALSMLILPIALYRGRLLGLWVVGVATAGVLVEIVGGVGMVGNVKYVLGVVAATAIAARILRLGDDEWRDPRLVSAPRVSERPA